MIGKLLKEKLERDGERAMEDAQLYVCINCDSNPGMEMRWTDVRDDKDNNPACPWCGRRVRR